MANQEFQPKASRVHQVEAMRAAATDMREKLSQEKTDQNLADARMATLILDLIHSKPASKNVIFESGMMDD